MTADDWSGYDLSTIWAMVENETHEVGYAQVDLWHRIETTCRNHAEAVTAALAKLTDSWPAKPGSAAETFQNVLADLVDAMNDTASVAGTNARELTGLTDHIMEVKDQISTMVAERDKLVKQDTAPGVPATNAAIGLRQRFDGEAQRLMAAKERDTAQSAVRVRVPVLYQMKVLGDDQPQGMSISTIGVGSAPSGGDGDSSDTGGANPLVPTWRPGRTGGGTFDSSAQLAGGIDLGSGDGQEARSAEAMGGPQSAAPKGVLPSGGGPGPGGPSGLVIGGFPGRTGSVSSGRPGTGDAAGTWSKGTASASASGGAGVHGAGGFMGAPSIMPGGGGPAMTRGGVRIGRPGEVIGGRDVRRRRPSDPDDPWAVEHDMVEPVIGAQIQADEPIAGDHEELPPGVVEIRWQ